VRAAKWQEEDITTRLIRGGRRLGLECTYEAMSSHAQTVVYCVVLVVGKRGSGNAAGCWCDVARGEPTQEPLQLRTRDYGAYSETLT
jgi:hypothetical protein